MKKWRGSGVLLIALLSAGCKKNPGPQPTPVDKYGYHQEDLLRVYERGAIRIDIPKTYNQDAQFNDQEADLLVQALNTLTDEELARLDLHILGSDYAPNQAQGMMMYRNDAVHGVAIFFNKPKSSRVTDPDIGNKLLVYLGFSGRKISANQVFNEETQEELFPEVLEPPIPLPAPLIPMPSMSVPTLPSAEPLLITPHHLTVTSPGTPLQYITITSRPGHTALGEEARIAATNDEKGLTSEDQIRPHGMSHE